MDTKEFITCPYCNHKHGYVFKDIKLWTQSSIFTCQEEDCARTFVVKFKAALIECTTHKIL